MAVAINSVSFFRLRRVESPIFFSTFLGSSAVRRPISVFHTVRLGIRRTNHCPSICRSSFPGKNPSFPGKSPPKNPEMARIELLDLEKQFAFYGAYHSNPINVLIHMLFVWPIAFTALMILYFTPSLFGSVEFFLLGHHVTLLLNVGFLLTVVYSLFYICFDVKAGTLAALLCVVCWICSSFIASRLGFSLTWKVVLVAQIVCWTGQFIGHGVYEKRAPALLDNLAQAFLMAPFFVLLEILQKLFNYEPYPGFHEVVQARIDSEIADWQDKKQKLIP